MEPGQTIRAWVLDRKLGEGGMGEVWSAHRADQPDVVGAFKRIKGDITAEAAQRFLREAAILADLDHPGIPAFLDYSTAPPFLVMEFVRGISLDDLLRQRGPLDVADALELTRQLVEAIAYIHGRDIWHRDVKPGNLILTQDGWVKLVDFGVARGDGYADLTAAGLLVGTMPYMPPEAFRGSEPSALAWDLYGAGVVLHRCLTGKNGFETSLTGIRGQTEQAQMKLSLDCLDPGEGFPEDVRDFVRDMTRQRPEGRMTSAGAIGRRLQGLLRSHPGADLARFATPADPPAEPVGGSRPWVIVGVVVGVVVVVLLPALVLILALLMTALITMVAVLA